MSISDKKGVQQLVEAFHHHGVKNIIFSPGSRNAPLVISFSDDARFECFVIPDERSAAFFALGMAEQMRQPTAVICTSGSALLNHYPAVSEAFYRNIPLIVLSADRPKEWIDQGDGQTIRQEDVLKNHVLAYTELFENPQNNSQEWFNRRTLDEVLIKAKQKSGGPVHINFPFTEPLYKLTESSVKNERNIELLELEKQLSVKQKEKLKKTWNESKKILVLCGQMPENSYLNEQLKNLATNKSVAVVVENTSNLQDRSFVHCIDRTITSFLDKNPELYQPDLLITIGGAVISKKIKFYLRKYQPKNHWKIGAEFSLMDTYQSLTTSIPMNVNAFFDTILNSDFERDMSRYGEQWKQLDYLAKGQHDDFVSTCRYSDLSVFNFILDAVPDFSYLHIANSSVIRYTQLFDPIKSIKYFCNRGTSGIDGSLSTALGITVASGEERINTIITGDMSFFYDSNAFWNHYLPTNLRIFLINNGGGGIFNIIPGPKSSLKVDEFFVSKHNFSAEHICKAFDVNYYKATNIEEIDHQLDEFYDVLPNERPALMEIFTDNEDSSKVLEEYFSAIKVGEVPVLKI
ncbi:MAG: 2-succinyl-5-enolpyruvyl-6-hydroxy-3-cyclohexene-1-carboxylic-acid synthase [Brumimicrobium sp.]